MTWKLKTLVAALTAAAASAPALANIDPYNPGVGTNGNGELFFNLYDPLAQTPVSFYFDLRQNASMVDAKTGNTLGTFKLNDFLPSVAAAGGSGVGAPGPYTNAPGFVEQPGVKLTWHFDANTQGFEQFVNLASGTSNWKWNVVAGDSTGSQVVLDNVRYLTTSLEADPIAPSQTQLNSWKGTDVYVSANNVASGTGADADDSATVTNAAGDAYFGAGFQDNWKGFAPFSSVAGVGEAQYFYYVSGRATSANGQSQRALIEQFDNGGFANGASWLFAANPSGGYDLTYMTAPVPEPETWAMLAAGLAVVGAYARRRRQQQQ